MLNIEFRDREDNFPYPYVIVNGISDVHSEYDKKDQSVKFQDESVIAQVIKYSFVEVSKYFDAFTMDWYLHEYGRNIALSISNKGDEHNKCPIVILFVDYYLELWANLWSYYEFQSELKRSLENSNLKNIEFYIDDATLEDLGNFSITCFVENDNSQIDTEIEKVLEVLNLHISKTEDKLNDYINQNSVSILLEFPKEINTACKQYLIYFAQFLADIGIMANTDIREQANKTLFTVTPINDKEALNKIREALNVFLHAPSLENFDIQISDNMDISVMQWAANVSHLKGQLMLAGAVIQAKGETIKALQLSNYQLEQKQIIKGKSENDEKILYGIVTIKEYDGKWFKIDFPKILKQLRRRF